MLLYRPDIHKYPGEDHDDDVERLDKRHCQRQRSENIVEHVTYV